MTQTPGDAPILEDGEKILAEFRPDRGKYWRDHGVMAVILMALAGFVLWAIDSPYPAIGSLGAILAVGVRAAYLAGETLSLRWVLTDRRLILPGGQRAVMLGDIATVRPLLGDVQIITTGGDKHLLKHLANGADVVRRIAQARDKRAKRRAA
ncbi:hypothetical protein [Pararhodobacter marinus]|uniref:hypothetical protein n=1 Tax=Pararhodobacter marinus TaxID=2184063 RepID=UPI0035163D8D